MKPCGAKGPQREWEWVGGEWYWSLWDIWPCWGIISVVTTWGREAVQTSPGCRPGMQLNIPQLAGQSPLAPSGRNYPARNESPAARRVPVSSILKTLLCQVPRLPARLSISLLRLYFINIFKVLILLLNWSCFSLFQNPIFIISFLYCFSFLNSHNVHFLKDCYTHSLIRKWICNRGI